MAERRGATPEDWDYLSLILGLTQDLLPVVSDLGVTISPDSTMKELGKTPSYISRSGAVGVAKWTQKQTTQAEIDRWRADGRLGVCIIARTVRAFDIDITDPVLAQQVADYITAEVGPLPCRSRGNSAKRLFAFALPGEIPKRVIKMASGMVEMLGTGQQFIACGTHPSGVRYEWAGGLPDEFPELTHEQFETVWAGLASTFGVSQSESAPPTKAKMLKEAAALDDTAQYLITEGYVKQHTREGALHIRCPFEEGHSTASSASATTYWPAHTGGYAQGHFHCLHASCAHRSDDDFRAEIGMPAEDLFEGFSPLLDPAVITDENGQTENASQKSVKKQRFSISSAADFSAHKPPGWIVKGVLPKASLAVLYGDSGSGKSFFALDMCGAIAQGKQWRGNRVEKGKVVYVCAEGAGGMRMRMQAYAKHHGVDLRGLDIGFVADAPNFMLAQDIRDLVVSVQAYGPASIIVVDTFAQVIPGANENAGEDVGKALEHCRMLHKYTGALVVLVHHSGKDSSKGARGWSGLRAAADAEIEITRVGDDRQAEVTKMKDGPEGAIFGFRLDSVQLGGDEDGEAITSCVAVESKAVVKPVKGSSESVQHLVMAHLEAADGAVPALDLKQAVVDRMTPPDAGKRDTRGDIVAKTLMALQDAGRLVMCRGFARLATVGTDGFSSIPDDG